MVTLSPSGLKTITTSDPNWVTTFNENMTLINDDLLKLSALGDVDLTGIANGDTIKYELAITTWKPFTPHVSPL